MTGPDAGERRSPTWETETWPAGVTRELRALAELHGLVIERRTVVDPGTGYNPPKVGAVRFRAATEDGISVVHQRPSLAAVASALASQVKRTRVQIVARREALGWYEELLGDAVGLGRSSIQRIERRQQVPNAIVAMKLARALNTDVETLFIDEIGTPRELGTKVRRGRTQSAHAAWLAARREFTGVASTLEHLHRAHEWDVMTREDLAEVLDDAAEIAVYFDRIIARLKPLGADEKLRRRIAALRVTAGRTPEEVEAFQARADLLEDKLADRPELTFGEDVLMRVFDEASGEER